MLCVHFCILETVTIVFVFMSSRSGVLSSTIVIVIQMVIQKLIPEVRKKGVLIIHDPS